MAELSSQDVFGGDHFLEKLLGELESMYPANTPNPNDDIQKIMYLAGQRSVVEYIKAKSNV
jgi:hypothetical protein